MQGILVFNPSTGCLKGRGIRFDAAHYPRTMWHRGRLPSLQTESNTKPTTRMTEDVPLGYAVNCTAKIFTRLS